MNPADLVTPQLINYCSSFKTIVVCGYTKTGKITIAKKLAEQLNRMLFISDDYSFEKYGDKTLEIFMSNVLPYHQKNIPIVIEGVLCFRLLRKGVQENCFYPDLILKTNCNDETITHFYKKDGEESKIPRALSFNKGLNKIWNDYLDLVSLDPRIKRPHYIELNTSL